MEQSASLPGSVLPSSRPLRRVRSRALRAALRARAALIAFSTIWRPSLGFSSRNSASFSLTVTATSVAISVLPSLVLVWPSNCGFLSLTETSAVRPSRMSSPVRLSSFSLRRFFCRA